MYTMPYHDTSTPIPNNVTLIDYESRLYSSLRLNGAPEATIDSYIADLKRTGNLARQCEEIDLFEYYTPTDIFDIDACRRLTYCRLM